MVWRFSFDSKTNDLAPLAVTLTRKDGDLLSRKKA
jgi:hypothetical protein